MIWRVRDRATFRALAAARRHRMGALSVTRIDTAPGEPPRVAFAVGRSVGNAVTRNRVRRRLRAAVRARAEHLRPGSAYLVGATPAATHATFREIETTLSVLFDRAAGEQR